MDGVRGGGQRSETVCGPQRRRRCRARVGPVVVWHRMFDTSLARRVQWAVPSVGCRDHVDCLLGQVARSERPEVVQAAGGSAIVSSRCEHCEDA